MSKPVQLRVTYSASATGSGGGPSVGDLKDFLNAIPDEASTRVSTYAGDQRDPSTWTLTATWDSTQHYEWINRDIR